MQLCDGNFENMNSTLALPELPAFALLGVAECLDVRSIVRLLACHPRSSHWLRPSMTASDDGESLAAMAWERVQRCEGFLRTATGVPSSNDLVGTLQLLWNLRRLEKRGPREIRAAYHRQTGRPNCVCVVGSEIALASGSDSGVSLIAVDALGLPVHKPPLLRTLVASSAVFAMVAVNSALALGTRDGPLEIWDVSALVRTQSAIGHRDLVSALIECNGALVSASEDTDLRVWAKGVKWTCKRVLSGHMSRIIALAAVRVGSRATMVASGCINGEVRIWNAASWACERALNVSSCGIIGIESVWGHFVVATLDARLHGLRRVKSWGGAWKHDILMKTSDLPQSSVRSRFFCSFLRCGETLLLGSSKGEICVMAVTPRRGGGRLRVAHMHACNLEPPAMGGGVSSLTLCGSCVVAAYNCAIVRHWR